MGNQYSKHTLIGGRMVAGLDVGLTCAAVARGTPMSQRRSRKNPPRRKGNRLHLSRLRRRKIPNPLRST